jgi:hypothetical protein
MYRPSTDTLHREGRWSIITSVVVSGFGWGGAIRRPIRAGCQFHTLLPPNLDLPIFGLLSVLLLVRLNGQGPFSVRCSSEGMSRSRPEIECSGVCCDLVTYTMLDGAENWWALH